MTFLSDLPHKHLINATVVIHQGRIHILAIKGIVIPVLITRR